MQTPEQYPKKRKNESSKKTFPMGKLFKWMGDFFLGIGEKPQGNSDEGESDEKNKRVLVESVDPRALAYSWAVDEARILNTLFQMNGSGAPVEELMKSKSGIDFAGKMVMLFSTEASIRGLLKLKTDCLRTSPELYRFARDCVLFLIADGHLSAVTLDGAAAFFEKEDISKLQSALALGLEKAHWLTDEEVGILERETF